MAEWEPLPEKERKEAEKRFNTDKNLLDRAHRRGQLTHEYYLEKVSELLVRYGLVSPEWTPDEALEFDLELDSMTDREEEQGEWQPLPEEERKKAEKQLLKEKKILNKAFNLGKVSREHCLRRVSELEVLLGLRPPGEPVAEEEAVEPVEGATVGEAPAEEVEPVEEAGEPVEAEGEALEEEPAVEPVEAEGEALEEEPAVEPALEEEELAGEPPVEEEAGEPAEVPGPVDVEEESLEEEPRGSENGMAECPECGAAVPEGSNYCDLCGAFIEAVDESVGTEEEAVEEPAPEEAEAPPEPEPAGETEGPAVVECPHCGATVPEGAGYCDLCGGSLEKVEPEPRDEAMARLMTVPGIGWSKAEVLYDAGFRGPEDLVECSVEELAEVKMIGEKTAQNIKDELRRMYPTIPEDTEPLPPVVQPAQAGPEPAEEPLAEAEPDEEELGEPVEDVRISKTVLIIGVLLCLAGLVGVIGLRMGFVQEYLFGDPNPYPGIGHVEPSGHVAAIVPFVIGIVAIFYWGIRNDHLYHERELARKELEDEQEPVLEPVYTEEGPETFGEEAGEPHEPGDAYEEPLGDSESVDEVIERERVDFCQKMLLSAYILEDDMARLEKAITGGISKEDFIKEIENAVDRRRESEKLERFEEELAEEMSEVENEDEEEEEILQEIEELEDF